MKLEYNIVNVVGGAHLDTKIDLRELYNEMKGYGAIYEPEQAGGLYFELPISEVTVMIFNKGGYHLTGAESVGNMYDGNKELLEILRCETQLEIKNTTPEVRNIVFSGDIGMELDLSSLSSDLEGVSDINNPLPTRLQYRNEEIEGTFTLFRTGSFLYTGASTEASAQESLDILRNEINSLLEDTS